MKRFLVPVDFSPASEKAFRFALGIAEKAKGTVILYHVYTPEENITVGSEKINVLPVSQMEEALMKRLKRFKKDIMGNADTPVSTVVNHNPVTDSIIDFAEQNHTDLIIMGAKQNSGLKKTYAGSVATHIAQRSNIPVLLVPPKFELKDPKQIVFATNYLKSDKQALAILLSFANLYPAPVIAVHLYNVNTVDEKEKNVFRAYAREMQKEFTGSDLKFQLMKTASITDAMETLFEKIPYDILAMVRRKKTFMENFLLKSYTQDIAYVTDYPLLVIPAKEEEVHL